MTIWMVGGAFALFGGWWICSAWIPIHERIQGSIWLLISTLIVISVCVLLHDILIARRETPTETSYDFLGRVAAFVIAFQLWSLSFGVLELYAPIKEGYSHVKQSPWDFINLVGPLAIAWISYKNLIWFWTRIGEKKTGQGIHFCSEEFMHDNEDNEVPQTMDEVEEKLDPENSEEDNEGVQGLVELLIGGFIGLCFVGLALALLAPQQRIGKGVRTPCMNNVRMISLAMQNYASSNMHFPPAFIADENGKPMHSWRVLILPYLEQDELFERYSFDEPWDGPNNSKLHDEIVSVYQCPSASRGEQGSNSNYMLVTGKGTGFDGPNNISISDIKDGSSNTILVVEVANSDTHWMEPVDLPIEEALARYTDPTNTERSCNHSEGLNFSLMDGSTHWMPVPTSAENLKALITIDGGEVFSVIDL